MDFDGLCEKVTEIYTLRQLYHTLRHEKALYPAEQLDIMARLKNPLGYDKSSMVGERDLCQISLNEIRRILPKMYPDIIPEPDIWEPKESPAFAVREGKKAEYRAFRGTNASDFYLRGVIKYAERWGGMMEQEMENGMTVAETAAETQYAANTEGIAGYMFGYAHTLCQFWEHGEELRTWYDQSHDYGEQADSNTETEELSPQMGM